MNNNPKIFLTIYVEGSTPRCIGETTEFYTLTAQDLTNKKLPQKEANKIVKKGSYKKKNIVYKEASIQMTLTQEAYDYMTSLEVPSWFLPHELGHRLTVWKRMSADERLAKHMAFIAASKNAKNFTYSVLED